MQRSSVVLPQPHGPTMHMISFVATARSSWRNATTVPSRNSFDAFSATIMGLRGVHYDETPIMLRNGVANYRPAA